VEELARLAPERSLFRGRSALRRRRLRFRRDIQLLPDVIGLGRHLLRVQADRQNQEDSRCRQQARPGTWSIAMFHVRLDSYGFNRHIHFR